MIEENKDITSLTTFGIPARARYYAEYTSEKELLRISRDSVFIENPVLSIGGGSNLLFVNGFNGLVLRSAIKGIVRYDKDADTVFAIVGAGERWTDFVDWCLDNGLGGVENMAGIPGDVGAAPVQNVGAYGVEAKDVVHAVECFDTFTRQTRRFTAEECRFGYRDSFFKHQGKGRYIVLRVSFRLRPDLTARNLEYGPLRELRDRLGHEPTIREVAEEVKRIRDSKLPDPAETGSAGSFFKNPVLHNGYIKEIKALTGYDIPGHAVGENHTKVSAAWLIDHAGKKGARAGGARVYERQPLVIANSGNATAADVVDLAEKVRLQPPGVHVSVRERQAPAHVGSGPHHGSDDTHRPVARFPCPGTEGRTAPYRRGARDARTLRPCRGNRRPQALLRRPRPDHVCQRADMPQPA